MHRHGYVGRKFHRTIGSRRALLKSLADSLIEHESIQTTLPKAKELVPYVEKLITKAKKGDLSARRQLISDLQTLSSAHKLMDEIAPKLKKRTSGHLRIEKQGFRRGDNAPLARVSFVDVIKGESGTEEKADQKQPRKQHHESTEQVDSTTAPVAERKTAPVTGQQNVQAPRRTGRRGNR